MEVFSRFLAPTASLSLAFYQIMAQQISLSLSLSIPIVILLFVFLF